MTKIVISEDNSQIMGATKKCARFGTVVSEETDDFRLLFWTISKRNFCTIVTFVKKFVRIFLAAPKMSHKICQSLTDFSEAAVLRRIQ